MLNPAIGAGTVTYFKSAPEKVSDLLEKLENSGPAAPGKFEGADATQPALNFSHLQLVIFFGLVLVTISLLRRRFRKKSRRPLGKADPAACFEAIGNRSIQYAAKTL